MSHSLPATAFVQWAKAHGTSGEGKTEQVFSVSCIARAACHEWAAEWDGILTMLWTMHYC